MAYDPITLIRARLLDTATPSLLATATAETVDYDGLYAEYGENSVETIRAAASILALYYANQPDSIGANGKSLSWRSRVEQWNAIAKGTAGGPVTETPGTAAGAATSGASRVEVVW